MKQLMNEKLSLLIHTAIMSYDAFMAQLQSYKLLLSSKKAELGEADTEDNAFLKTQKALQRCVDDFDRLRQAIEHAVKNNDMYQLATLRLPQHVESYTEHANKGAQCCNKLLNVENEAIQDFRQDLMDMTEIVRNMRDEMNNICGEYAERIETNGIEVKKFLRVLVKLAILNKQSLLLNEVNNT